VKLIGIGTNDIADGKAPLILALVKTLIFKYQIEASADREEKKQSKANVKKSLLNYVQQEASEKKISVESLKNSCQSGLLLFALLDGLNPGCVDFEELDTKDPVALNNEAIDVAFQLFKIPKIVNGKDLIENPEETIVMCYLSYFRETKFITHVYRSMVSCCFVFNLFLETFYGFVFCSIDSKTFK
jgi:hypothetical protein